MQEKSLFASSLAGLLDFTNFFTRAEWAEFLGISTSTIEEWTTDEALPRPDQISIIVIALDSLNDIPQEPLQQFKHMSIKLATEVSPLGKLMLPTVYEYIHRPGFSELSSKLAKLSPNEQEALLVSLYLPPAAGAS